MADDLDQLLSARREIDRAIAEHTREVAVMFTDIVGSTQYFERKGDIEGLSLVKRHNAALFPVVAAHGGRVVKTIGDAIMAVFEDPPAGVRCGLEMQRVLSEHNRQVGEREQEIHVRIGVHAGKVVLDQGDVFGDTVNTASRIAHEAQGDEVLISASLAALAPPADVLRTEPRGSLTLKGKAEPMPVVRALWRDDLLPAAREPETSGPRERSAEVFVLELGMSSEGLRVAVLDGSADKATVKSYQEVPLTRDALDRLAAPFGAFARGASSSYVEQLRAVGQELFRQTLSDRAQRRLQATTLLPLRLQLDDQLAHVPWELLHDGQEFLGLRFAVGRLVAARSQTSPALRVAGRRLERAVVVGDPGGDLPAARREGQAVAGLFREGLTGKVELLEGPVTRAAFLKAITGCDLLHFAGHARAGDGGGFLLADGPASPEEVRRAIGGSPPLLVFANGCHASTSGPWVDAARGLYTLGSALLLGGVQHYLGPLWEIPDADALGYALRFYEGALAGLPLGEAARRARRSLMQPPAQPTSFAGYVLYGEPRAALPAESIRLAPSASVRSSGEVRSTRVEISSAPRPVAGPPLGQPIAAFTSAHPAVRASRPVLAAALGAVVILGGAAGALLLHKSPAPTPAPVVDAPAAPTAPVTDPKRHTGPLRLSVLPFKNVSGDASLDHLRDALAEAMVTDLGGLPDTRLIERGQLDVDLGELEFSQTKYVDPSTRAALGKINGAEVVVLGGYQRVGDQIRVNARLVDAETGEILSSVKAERPATQLFELQDAVTAELRKGLGVARARLRP